MGTDPRFIPVSERGDWNLNLIVLKGGSYTGGFLNGMLDHAAFMDERDARQRDLIRRLADALAVEGDSEHGTKEEVCVLLDEARGIEATNE